MNTIKTEDKIEIKPGYKKTPVGIIPEDWEVKEINDFAEIKGRIGFRGYTKDDIVKEGKGAVSISPSNFKNGVLDITNATYISWFKYEESPEIKVEQGDVLLVKTGSTYGKTCFVQNLPLKSTINPQIIIIKKVQINKRFLGFLVSTSLFNKEIERIVVGGAIPTISQKEIAKIQLPIPPLPEQKAIADCLSTWDKGIEKLSALIASKKQQKKGLMQQLLTGKKRLDGFTEEWEYKKISEVAQVIGGGTPSTTNDEYWNGEINWFTPTEIKNKFVSESLRTITEKGLKNSSAKLLPPGTILLTTRATIGEASIAKNECSTNQGFQSIVCIDGKANVFFFYDLIRYNKKEFLRRANGSTFLEISKKEIDKIEFYIPSYKEQTAIAEVLSAADKEIELFEKKLDQFKTQKKGLMQVLLTGQRRLLN